MEKNQQNRSVGSQSSSAQDKTSQEQPGQQLPTGSPADLDLSNTGEGKMEQHSESSFPQQDEETLGTP